MSSVTTRFFSLFSGNSGLLYDWLAKFISQLIKQNLTQSGERVRIRNILHLLLQYFLRVALGISPSPFRRLPVMPFSLKPLLLYVQLNPFLFSHAFPHDLGHPSHGVCCHWDDKAEICSLVGNV